MVKSCFAPKSEHTVKKMSEKLKKLLQTNTHIFCLELDIDIILFVLSQQMYRLQKEHKHEKFGYYQFLVKVCIMPHCASPS